ncbi:MAG: prepilin peptidase [Filifactoraceae bacterium]
MENIIVVLMFILALCLGSFYNVVIYRMPLDLGIVKGRSFCPECNTSLNGFDLIPVVSYIVLKGKCRYCKSNISLRYPLIEITTGLLMLCSYYNNVSITSTLRFFVFWSMLLIVTMIDFDHMFILDSMLIFFGIIDVVFIVLVKSDIGGGIKGAIVCGSIYLIIYLVSKFFYKREVFGMGDVLLMINIGLFLGEKYSILACFFPFYVASFILLVQYFLKKRIALKSEIPFGPYICASAFIISLYGDAIQSYIMNIL